MIRIYVAEREEVVSRIQCPSRILNLPSLGHLPSVPVDAPSYQVPSTIRISVPTGPPQSPRIVTSVGVRHRLTVINPSNDSLCLAKVLYMACAIDDVKAMRMLGFVLQPPAVSFQAENVQTLATGRRDEKAYDQLMGAGGHVKGCTSAVVLEGLDVASEGGEIEVDDRSGDCCRCRSDKTGAEISPSGATDSCEWMRGHNFALQRSFRDDVDLIGVFDTIIVDPVLKFHGKLAEGEDVAGCRSHGYQGSEKI